MVSGLPERKRKLAQEEEPRDITPTQELSTGSSWLQEERFPLRFSEIGLFLLLLHIQNHRIPTLEDEPLHQRRLLSGTSEAADDQQA